MRKHIKYLIFLLVGMLSLSGCAAPLALEVSLEAPANGSTVSSLTPILAWASNYADASFRLQVSTDSNFQDLIMDQSGLSSPSYTISEGKLSEGQTYYWKVNASKGGQVSNWSATWVFQTPGGAPPPPPPPTPEVGTITVKATLDGASWTGGVNYNISGPQNYSSSSVVHSFSNVPTGSYTIGYSSGGPAGATLSDISPSSSQTLSAGGTITFTLNFETGAVAAIRVNAILDGDSWTGNVNYTITGPQEYSGSSVSETFSNVPEGRYTIGYNSGGPTGATLASITPHPTQSVVAGQTTTFTLNFHSENTSAVKVKATLDGRRWTGKVNYTITGPLTDSDNSVDGTFKNLPTGTYTLSYNYGGPPGARLISITPQPTQTVSADATITFTMNFDSEATSAIRIQATLDGSPWNGSVSYIISGPYQDAESSVPQTLTNLPDGTYTLTYRSGGPSGASLYRIDPSATQTLDHGQTITFTLVFHSQETTGTIMFNTLLDGKPWKTQPGSGPISYCISGPYSDCSSTMPDTLNNMPPGQYTCTYKSGGPIGATFIGVSPHARQTLTSGGMITFTLNFTSEARGTVTVLATVNGAPWEGDVSYTLAGPYVDSHGSVPYTFDNCPSGHYTVNYRSGGPEGYQFYGVSPTDQNLVAGGAITFTLNFVGLPGEDGGLLK